MDYKIQLNHIRESCEIVRCCDDAQSFVMSLILPNFAARDFIFIARNDSEIELFEKQLRFFTPHLDEKFEILNFTSWDCQPYDRSSPKQMIASERMRTLSKLINRHAQKNYILLTTVGAILQKIIPPQIVRNSGLMARAKTKISIEQITEFLVFNGYQRQISANDAGDFAVRGGIVDIVMNRAGLLIGYRIDFFGDEIEVIKEFDPSTQLSQDVVRQIEILPASEVILNRQTAANFREEYRKNFGASFALLENDQLYEAVSQQRSYPGMEHWLPFFYKEELVSIFEYLPDSVLFFNQQIFSQIKERDDNIREHYQARVDGVKESKISGNIYNPIKPELLYLQENELKKIIATNVQISFNNFDSANKNGRVIDLGIEAVPDFALAGRTNQKDPFELLKEYVGSQTIESLRKMLIACLTETSQDRLKKLLLDYNLNIKTCLLPINQGFKTSDFMLIGEQAIFGEKIIRKKNSNKKAAERILEEGLSINLGELVVHRNHGIGKFDGIHHISAGAVKTDMIKIIYGGSDTLFVPVEDIELITRYGADNPLIQLDRLGVATWKNRKEKVRNRIKVAAEELIKIAAARHVRQAPIFIPDQHIYDEFKARFGYVETDDQLKAIEEVEEDLAKGSPMDRLICGDVGFGKTEVAMRAAFIVAHEKKYQVAIITPTTLLCRQHFHNFTKRFEGTNINIRQLSRLNTTTEHKKIKEEIESGKVDIIIGTHALLNKTLKFKNLALVIVDEEQHFGVAQKERLKEFRNEVHILTLSATPIPRTLQMSLTGVKELSLIATPPLDRLAVRNFVMPYDHVIVREAILREYHRSGKTFFVVPRVSDIREMEDKLKKAIPEVKITHAHGQMTPNELDKIMNDFYDGKIDVLLSTTIIESGIDVSTANTIIIYKAEMFGLAQLYQLRGRVGRGKIRGYAYFMLSPKKLSRESKQKLEVMQNLDDLGIGFTIASHDMDIRGSGDILGDEQSGHIKETGAELYQQLLVEEIAKLKAGMARDVMLRQAQHDEGSEAQNEEGSKARYGKESEAQNGEESKTQRKENNNKNVMLSLSKYDNITELTDFTPQIKLGISLLIEESYIPDLALRMSFYKKIAQIKSTDEQDQLMNEMLDRFGKMSEKVKEEIENLMRVSILKHECKKLEIEKLEATKEGIQITFCNNKFKHPEKLLQMIFADNKHWKLQANQKVLFVTQNLTEAKIDSAFKAVNKLLKI